MLQCKLLVCFEKKEKKFVVVRFPLAELSDNFKFHFFSLLCNTKASGLVEMVSEFEVEHVDRGAAGKRGVDCDKECGLWDKGRGLWDEKNGLWDKGHGLWDERSGLWDKGRGLWDEGSGLWDKGRGLWDERSGLWDKGRGKKVTVNIGLFSI